MVLRPNHLLPPFNHPKVREALYYILGQEDYLRAIVGDPSLYKVCPAMFICGAPLETTAGAENLKVDLIKAKQLLKDGVTPASASYCWTH